MPEVVTSIEYLSFDADSPHPAIALNTPAWKVTSYTALRKRTRVGENRPIPGAPGRLYVPREWDEQTVVLPMKINGRLDHEGDAHEDWFDGVDVNHQYLLDHIVDVLAERDVTFHRRDGATFQGSVVVDEWEPSDVPKSGGTDLVSFLTLKVMDGYLTQVGS